MCYSNIGKVTLLGEIMKIKNPNWSIQSYVLGGILILLFVAVLRLIAPFFAVLLWAVLLYIVLSPLHSRLIKHLGFDTLKGKILLNVWAGVFALGTMVIILFPVSVLVFLFVQQAADLILQVRKLIYGKPEFLYAFFEKIAGFINNVSDGQLNITADYFVNQLGTVVNMGLQKIIPVSSNIARNIGSFLLSMLLVTFSVFFFFRDGPYLFHLLVRAIPIKSEYISTLAMKFRDITRNLFLGYISVAAMQAVLAFIVYTIFGVKGALVLAVLTFIMVFVPMIGATIIWIPIGVSRIAGGDIVGGVLFLLVAGIFISSIDNLIRPFLLKDRINLHPFIIFFAILGGIFVFGFKGFILGPVLVILFLTVLDIFLIEHKME